MFLTWGGALNTFMDGRVSPIFWVKFFIGHDIFGSKKI